MKGIYQIRNKINGNRYIGLSSDINRRFTEHKTPKNIRNKNTVLSRAFRKYGIENFEFEIVEELDNDNDLPIREIFWISKLNPEYNMNDGGLGNRSLFVSKHIRERLSEKGKTQWKLKSPEEKKRIIENNLKGPKLGHTVSEKTKELLRVANLGKKQSIETRGKRSLSLSGKPRKNLHHYKKIICYNNETAPLLFYSIKSAAEKFNKRPEQISSVLTGKRKHCAGLKWEYYTNQQFNN